MCLLKKIVLMVGLDCMLFTKGVFKMTSLKLYLFENPAPAHILKWFPTNLRVLKFFCLLIFADKMSLGNNYLG